MTAGELRSLIDDVLEGTISEADLLRLEADSVIRLLLDVGVCSSETPLAAVRFLTPLSGLVKCAYVTTHREEQ